MRMAEPAGRALAIDALTSGYDEGIVLDGLSLSVAAGEAVGLAGRNGAGKTTLLRTIMGLLRPRSGAIAFGGERIDGRRPFEIARRGIAYVPQGRDVFADLTVEQNLILGDLRAADAEEAYALFPALRDKRGEPAGRLSGGQQQQLAIARALMGRPRLLLLDEPSEGIQPSVIDEIGGRLAQIVAGRGMSLLLVEQNLALMLALTSRVAMMDNGRVMAEEESAALARDPSLLEAHLSL
jgi:ABC-type branched-subunit amino acid transport system ATPase component